MILKLFLFDSDFLIEVFLYLIFFVFLSFSICSSTITRDSFCKPFPDLKVIFCNGRTE